MITTQQIDQRMAISRFDACSLAMNGQIENQEI
jgi:hypothetical protein